MVTYFLPHFLKLSVSSFFVLACAHLNPVMQEQGRPSLLVTVTSGLAIVPGPWVPNYCATKAALHSFTISLNTQLKDTKVKVVELFPPYVIPSFGSQCVPS